MTCKFFLIAIIGSIIPFFVVPAASADPWGDIGLGVYPSGSKVAPNRLIYHPLFFLSANINTGNPQGIYLFVDAAFYTEKATPGITTNLEQGKFDFSKRQFDLSGGLAYRFNSIEGRARAFSSNNLNRGLDYNIPVGFKDGVTLEGRWCYGEGSEAHDSSQQYIAIGYSFSNAINDTAGESYKPGFFAKATGLYNIPILPKVFVFGSMMLVASRGSHLKELQTAAGAGYRIGEKLELRASYERDFGLGDELPDRDRFVIALHQVFGWQ